MALDQVRAQFSACMAYRVAAGVLEHLLPIDAGIDPETLHACTLKVGADLIDTVTTNPAVAASAITLTGLGARQRQVRGRVREDRPGIAGR
jgi:hypothetical protein